MRALIAIVALAGLLPLNAHAQAPEVLTLQGSVWLRVDGSNWLRSDTPNTALHWRRVDGNRWTLE